LRRDPGNHLQTLDQQILQAVIDPVEPAAQFVKISLGRQHDFDRFPAGR
jgi:hypothetical protein